MKDMRDLQKQGKAMTPPEHRGVVGGFRAMKEGVAQANEMMGNIAEQQQKAQMLMANGVVGQATIDSVTDTGVTVNENPQIALALTVTIPGKDPYQATLTQVVSRLAIAGFQPGSTVPVRVSPDDPQVLMIG
jgi:protein-disulfide isomerase